MDTFEALKREHQPRLTRALELLKTRVDEATRDIARGYVPGGLHNLHQYVSEAVEAAQSLRIIREIEECKNDADL